MDEYDDFAAGATDRERAIRRRVQRLGDFYRHLCIYILIVGLMCVFAAWPLLSGAGYKHKWQWMWVLFPAGGWGIGLFFHGLSVLPRVSFFSNDWEDRKVKEILARDAQRDRS
ncbi:MAG: hypothetical protein EAZ30_08485 [Betaproteobacteria bacterium]|nr:MAG: hypothetical protein EAZ43_06455 [Betaproteobacteria bacterium]TAG47570.1 MAG: hypothetical protein EAZ30_08485 [Betaproteobacteria bacterium]